MRPIRGAMRPDPARAFPCPPAARWVPVGPLGTAPPRAGPVRAVLAPAGARGAPAGLWGAKTRFGPVAARLGGLVAMPRRFGHPLRSLWWAPAGGKVPKSDPKSGLGRRRAKTANFWGRLETAPRLGPSTPTAAPAAQGGLKGPDRAGTGPGRAGRAGGQKQALWVRPQCGPLRTAAGLRVWHWHGHQAIPHSPLGAGA